jgi:hypothetical protein
MKVLWVVMQLSLSTGQPTLVGANLNKDFYSTKDQCFAQVHDILNDGNPQDISGVYWCQQVVRKN